MSGRNRIALFGTGGIGKLIYSGIDALHTTEKIGGTNDKEFFNSLTSVIRERDYKSLVSVYKKVQKKYYPEKDILNNRR